VLDGLASDWQRQGIVGVSINWGAWSGGGMASGDSGTAVRLEKLGLGMVDPSAGLAALGVLMRQEGLRSSVAVTPFNASLFSKHLPSGSAGMMEDLLQRTPVRDLGETILQPSDDLPRLSEGRVSLPPCAPPQNVQQQVVSCAESILGFKPDLSTPLTAAGIDSLGAVELRNMLQEQFSIELAATVLYDYPTIAEISGHVASLCSPAAQDKQPQAQILLEFSSAIRGSKAYQATPKKKSVEIVRSACRTPQDAVASLGALDAVSLIPANKWDIDLQMSINQSSSGR
jgi:acyl carrier protein